MGKGFNNYMTKKFFHPSSKDNIKRVWMAQQKTEFDKKKQEDMLAQYQKEQDMYGNRALLGDEKAKLGLNFMYDPPPGLKTKEKEDDEPEYKFEWQRKFNAPREAYAKDDETIRDQPFGIEVRNVRCIKCRQWGHVNTDKICPLFGKNLTAEPPQPGQNTKSLVEGMKEDGFTMKRNLLGNISETAAASQGLLDGADDNDPEVQFLRSLTPEQRKKLLKKLNKLKKKQKEKKKDKKKDKKKKSKHSKRKNGDDSERRHRKKKSDSSSEDGDSCSDSDDSGPVRKKELCDKKLHKSSSSPLKADRKRSHLSSSSEEFSHSRSKISYTADNEQRYSRQEDDDKKKMKHTDLEPKLLSHSSQRDREEDKRKRGGGLSYDDIDYKRNRDNALSHSKGEEKRRRKRQHSDDKHCESSESGNEDRKITSDRSDRDHKSDRRHERREHYNDKSHRHEYKEKQRDRHHR